MAVERQQLSDEDVELLTAGARGSARGAVVDGTEWYALNDESASQIDLEVDWRGWDYAETASNPIISEVKTYTYEQDGGDARLSVTDTYQWVGTERSGRLRRTGTVKHFGGVNVSENTENTKYSVSYRGLVLEAEGVILSRTFLARYKTVTTNRKDSEGNALPDLVTYSFVTQGGLFINILLSLRFREQIRRAHSVTLDAKVAQSEGAIAEVSIPPLSNVRIEGGWAHALHRVDFYTIENATSGNTETGEWPHIGDAVFDQSSWESAIESRADNYTTQDALDALKATYTGSGFLVTELADKKADLAQKQADLTAYRAQWVSDASVIFSERAGYNDKAEDYYKALTSDSFESSVQQIQSEVAAKQAEVSRLIAEQDEDDEVDNSSEIDTLYSEISALWDDLERVWQPIYDLIDELYGLDYSMSGASYSERGYLNNIRLAQDAVSLVEQEIEFSKAKHTLMSKAREDILNNPDQDVFAPMIHDSSTFAVSKHTAELARAFVTRSYTYTWSGNPNDDPLVSVDRSWEVIVSEVEVSQGQYRVRASLPTGVRHSGSIRCVWGECITKLEDYIQVEPDHEGNPDWLIYTPDPHSFTLKQASLSFSEGDEQVASEWFPTQTPNGEGTTTLQYPVVSAGVKVEASADIYCRKNGCYGYLHSRPPLVFRKEVTSGEYPSVGSNKSKDYSFMFGDLTLEEYSALDYANRSNLPSAWKGPQPVYGYPPAKVAAIEESMTRRLLIHSEVDDDGTKKIHTLESNLEDEITTAKLVSFVDGYIDNYIEWQADYQQVIDGSLTYSEWYAQRPNDSENGIRRQSDGVFSESVTNILDGYFNGYVIRDDIKQIFRRIRATTHLLAINFKTEDEVGYMVKKVLWRLSEDGTTRNRDDSVLTYKWLETTIDLDSGAVTTTPRTASVPTVRVVEDGYPSGRKRASHPVQTLEAQPQTLVILHSFTGEPDLSQWGSRVGNDDAGEKTTFASDIGLAMLPQVAWVDAEVD